MDGKMTLEQVRDEVDKHEHNPGYFVSIGTSQLAKWRDAIDAHLTQPAQAVDGLVEVSVLRNLIRGNGGWASCFNDELFVMWKDIERLIATPSTPEFTTPDCPNCGYVDDGKCLCTPSAPSATKE